jgi:hypothetical protein
MVDREDQEDPADVPDQADAVTATAVIPGWAIPTDSKASADTCAIGRTG